MPYPTRGLALIAALIASGGAHAQPAPAASAPTTAAERAQRDADKVFQMILQHADKPRRVVREERPAAPPPVLPSRPAATEVRAAPRAAPATAVTASTPPPVIALPQAPADEGAAKEAAALQPSPPPAAVEAPQAALAPVAVATPRSLKLELVSSVEPEFPARLVRSLGTGSVLVNFEVRPDGTVTKTEVVRSSHRGLNAAAEAAVAAWRFKPVSETLPGVVELKFE